MKESGQMMNSLRQSSGPCRCGKWFSQHGMFQTHVRTRFRQFGTRKASGRQGGSSLFWVAFGPSLFMRLHFSTRLLLLATLLLPIDLECTPRSKWNNNQEDASPLLPQRPPERRPSGSIFGLLPAIDD